MRKLGVLIGINLRALLSALRLGSSKKSKATGIVRAAFIGGTGCLYCRSLQLYLCVTAFQHWVAGISDSDDGDYGLSDVGGHDGTGGKWIYLFRTGYRSDAVTAGQRIFGHAFPDYRPVHRKSRVYRPVYADIRRGGCNQWSGRFGVLSFAGSRDADADLPDDNADDGQFPLLRRLLLLGSRTTRFSAQFCILPSFCWS